jgi:hypothetical protein
LYLFFLILQKNQPMKRLLFLAAVLYAGLAQAQVKSEDKAVTGRDPKIQGTVYGQAFSDAKAISVSELSAKASRADDKEVHNVAVYAKIDEVCQAEGCWMRVEKGDGTTMLVKFKDHDFVIPKNLAGKNAVFYGRAYQGEVSVKMLRHYAEDAGKSKDEIEKITEPSNELAFEATGVIIK